MRTATVALLLVLAGCAAAPEPTVDPPAADATLLQVAGPGGLANVTSIPGLQQADDGSWTFDALDGMQPDSVRLLMFQASDSGRFEGSSGHSLNYSDPGPLGEGTDVESVCTFGFDWQGGPGDFFIDRAQGLDVPYPDVPFQGGASGGSGGSGGSQSGENSMAGRLDAGEWLVLGFGLAGIRPDVVTGDGFWRLHLDFDDLARVVEPAPAPFRCGDGFASMGGTTVGQVHQGGRLHIEAPYGGFFDFCPTFDPASSVPTNAGTVEFLGDVRPLTGLAPVHLRGQELGTVAMSIEQWVGTPSWTARGLALPLEFTSPFC